MTTCCGDVIATFWWHLLLGIFWPSNPQWTQIDASNEESLGSLGSPQASSALKNIYCSPSRCRSRWAPQLLVENVFGRSNWDEIRKRSSAKLTYISNAFVVVPFWGKRIAERTTRLVLSLGCCRWRVKILIMLLRALIPGASLWRDSACDACGSGLWSATGSNPLDAEKHDAFFFGMGVLNVGIVSNLPGPGKHSLDWIRVDYRLITRSKTIGQARPWTHRMIVCNQTLDGSEFSHFWKFGSNSRLGHRKNGSTYRSPQPA